MRRRLRVRVALVALIVPGLVSGFEAVGGGCGLFRVQDVKSEGYGWLSLTEHTFLRELDEQYMGDLYAGLAAAPFDWMELMFVSSGYAVGADTLFQTGARHNFVRSLTDTRFGAKLGMTLLPVIKLGVAGFYQLNTRDDTVKFRDYPLLPGKGWEVRGLLGLDLKDVLPTLPLNVLANYGYAKGNFSYLGLPASDTVWYRLGAGIEWPSKYLDGFLELTNDYPKGEKPFSSATYMYATPGIRFRFGFGLGIDLAMNFGLSASMPKQTYVVGLNYSSPAFRPAPKPVGTISGTILDYRTNAPLVATLSLPDLKLKNSTKLLNVTENGVFRLDKLPAGPVTLVVEMPGYQKFSTVVTVKKDEVTIQDIKLHTLKQYGSIAGRVTDDRTGAPVLATVQFPGSGLAEVQTDSSTGVFTVKDAPVGAVAVEVQSEGYQNGSASVTVSDNEVTTQNFALRPLRVFGTLTGRVLDATTKNPLAATITFPESSALPAAHTDSGGVFNADKIPVGTIAIDASAPGYIHEVQPVVVEEGKVANVDFLLRPAQEFGSMSGTVTDVNVKPLVAQVTLSDPSLPAATTDTTTGFYKLDKIPVGTLVAKVTADGFIPTQRTVTIEANKSLTQNFTLSPTQEYGAISGSVTDAASGHPVKATISFSDTTLAAVTTDTLTGFYQTGKIPAGVMVLKAVADGYFPGQMTVTIEANKTATQNFLLNPAVQNGQLSGIVTDTLSKKPLKATIFFPGSGIPPVTSDSATGFYKASVPIGATVVACSLSGYAVAMVTSPVVVNKGAPAVHDFHLVKIGATFTLGATDIHFDFNSANIQPAGYPVLDGWVQILKQNPYMTAEIQGHTDAVGSDEYNFDLSNRRAASVVNYLVGRGIDRTRLTPRGYGKTMLLVQTSGPNETNRRVVLRVTGQVKPKQQ